MACYIYASKSTRHRGHPRRGGARRAGRTRLTTSRTWLRGTRGYRRGSGGREACTVPREAGGKGRGELGLNSSRFLDPTCSSADLPELASASSRRQGQTWEDLFTCFQRSDAELLAWTFIFKLVGQERDLCSIQRLGRMRQGDGPKSLSLVFVTARWARGDRAAGDVPREGGVEVLQKDDALRGGAEYEGGGRGVGDP